MGPAFSSDQVERQTRGEGVKKEDGGSCFSWWHCLYFLLGFLCFPDGGRNQAISRNLYMELRTITYSPLLSTAFWIRKASNASIRKNCPDLKWNLKATLRVKFEMPSTFKTLLTLSSFRSLLLYSLVNSTRLLNFFSHQGNAGKN